MPIQIRLTVLEQPGGRGAPGAAGAEGAAGRDAERGVDVQVSAPEGTPLAEVLGGLAAAAAPGAGVPGAVFCEESRLDPRRALLGHPPLVDGAVIAFHRPVADAVPEAPAARLLVVSGPDAGGVHLLRGGEVRVGRSAQADVPLDDPDVSRLHCAISVAADGSVTVTDLGSTNGTLLGGEPVTGGPVPLPAGAALRLGESTLRLLTDTAWGAAGPSGPAGPPRPVSVEPVAPAAPAVSAGGAEPGGRRASRGLAGWARRLSATAGDTHPVLPSPPSRAEPEPDTGSADASRWPDPAAVLLTALRAERAPEPFRLWERGPSHPEALALRLGTTQRAGGRLTPTVVSLREAGSLGLAGPRPRLLGLARSLLAQLAVLHPPSALELVVVAPGRAREWSWLGWLPQLRPTRGQDCQLLVGFDPEQAAARVAELTDRLGDPDPAGRRTVVLVDTESIDPATDPLTDPLTDPAGPAGGGHGGGPREALARLAAEGPAAGVHLLCLADAPAATPASPLAETLALVRQRSPAFAGCGATGLLSGAVASGLRLSGAGVRPGRRVGPGPVATVDAVSAAWAERCARALAPVREEVPEGAATAAAPAPAPAAPPDSCRLLDALDLPRVTPGALRERWARRAGELPLVLGAAADGPVVVELDGVFSPVRVEGGRSSGRTELLCALAASLAAARDPSEVSLLLVEGAGEGLRPSAELPHVASYLGATDPVRMRAFAQSLRDELRRRAALLGDDAEFSGGFAQGRPQRRVVAPRPPHRDTVAGSAPGVGRGGGAAGADRARAAELGGEARVGARLDAAPQDAPFAMAAEGSGPLPWLVVLVDDYDALLAPPLGAPGRQAAGSVLRALDAVAREGPRLGVRLITASTPGQIMPQAAPPATLRVALTGPCAGRAELRSEGGVIRPFQVARVTGRIPRTSTLRPTVTRLDWARAGDPPTRRPVRELGNGPTDMALLASAAARATRVGRETTASLV